MIKWAKHPHEDNEKSTDPAEVIEQLEKIEKLTALTWQELMAMNDTELSERDNEACAQFLVSSQAIQTIKKLSKDAIKRINEVCLSKEAKDVIAAVLDKMGIEFDKFMTFREGYGRIPDKDAKKYKVAGMRCAHFHARLIRIALRKELGEI